MLVALYFYVFQGPVANSTLGHRGTHTIMFDTNL